MKSCTGKIDLCNIIFIGRKPIVNLISLRLLPDYEIMVQQPYSPTTTLTLAFGYFHYRSDNILFRGTSFHIWTIYIEVIFRITHSWLAAAVRPAHGTVYIRGFLMSYYYRLGHCCFSLQISDNVFFMKSQKCFSNEWAL
jgi:hypothetical protein